MQNPTIFTSQNHPSFGMVMPKRSYTSSGGDYRFGFNRKEKDSEGMGGGGSTYDYGFRIYNPQLGKFLSVDPLAKSYPFYTPYQFAGNMPIAAIDLDGLEEFIIIRSFYEGNPEPVVELAFNWDIEPLRGLNYYVLDNYYDKDDGFVGGSLSKTDQFKVEFDKPGSNESFLQRYFPKVAEWLDDHSGGGFYLYSKNGEGTSAGREGKWKKGDPITSLNIDDFPIPNGGGGQFNFKSVNNLKELEKAFEKLDIILDGNSALHTAWDGIPDAEDEAKADVNEYIINPIKNVLNKNDTLCPYCKKEPHGTGTVVYDKNENPIDTIEEPVFQNK